MEKSYAKKKYSQNFLNDKNILNKICSIVDIKDSNVIEIGPGKGSLTRILLEKAKLVVAFEIDNNLFNYLNKTIENSKLKLFNSNFLLEDLSKYKDFNIVANIPYNISTDIIFKIFENYKNFKNVILLVQKEFGLRLCADENDKYYSKLSPTTKLFYDAKYCFDVSPNYFWPKPKVISGVVWLKRTNKKYDLSYNEIMNFIKLSFSMKRKTFWNNIKDKYSNYEKFKSCCIDLNLNLDVRAENLSLDNLIYFFKNLQ